MTNMLHWIGVALALAVVAFALVGFWRGLALPPTDPDTRAPERWWSWRWWLR